MKNSFLKKYQKQYELFKANHVDFELTDIFEVHLPFWNCICEVVAEKSKPIDQFSKVILQTVMTGIHSHSEICAFLGITEDAFVTVQFHYLVKNGLLKEHFNEEGLLYEITPEGSLFLKKKHTIKQLETVKFHFKYNDLLQTFFDDTISIDSMNKKQQKSVEYRLLETRRLQTGFQIKHKNKPYKLPTLEFATYFNKKMSGYTFYDKAETSIKAHKRSISFLAFEYTDSDNSKYYDIRTHQKSTKKFKSHVLEEDLSIAVTEYSKKYPIENNESD